MQTCAAVVSTCQSVKRQFAIVIFQLPWIALSVTGSHPLSYGQKHLPTPQREYLNNLIIYY